MFYKGRWYKIAILLGSKDISDLVSFIRPSTKRIGYSSKRSLNGTLWSSYAAIKKFFTLEFDLLSQTDRDDILNIFITASSVSFSGYDTSTYTVQLVGEGIDEDITHDSAGTPFYTLSITIEEQ